MSDSLRQGRIVWVELFDPQGRNPKVRPAVIVTSSSRIQLGGDVVVVAITSQVDSVPAEVRVELPWHRDRHPRTKLDWRNAAVCSWLATIRIDEIRSTGGQVPIPELVRILNIVAGISIGEIEARSIEEPT